MLPGIVSLRFVYIRNCSIIIFFFLVEVEMPHRGMHAALSLSIFLACAQGESPFSLSTLELHYIVKVCFSLHSY